MNTKEVIEKIKQTFSELVNVEKVNFMDAALKDGTPIQVTELAVGGIVTINGTPAPAGEHELSDGTIIVVGDNGAIMEIKQPAATSAPEETAPAAEDMGAKFSAFESSTNEKFASYEAKFAAYEQRFADYENKLNLATKVINDLIQLTQKISETPTGTIDESVKTSNNFHSAKKEKGFNYDLLFSK